MVMFGIKVVSDPSQFPFESFFLNEENHSDE